MTRFIVALLTIVTIAACGSSAPAEPATQDLTGYIVITEDCDDLGGFADIPKLSPILRDADGTIVGEFQPDPRNGRAHPRPGTPIAGQCLTRFDYPDAPVADVFELDAGRRGTFVITAGEISADGVAFQLTIG